SFFFFFSSRRRHTRSYGDWSSDVCSSDLIIDNDALLFRELARAFHDHAFSCGARDFEPNIPVLGSMHDEQQFPFRVSLPIQFDIRSFELKTEVPPENTNRLA